MTKDEKAREAVLRMEAARMATAIMAAALQATNLKGDVVASWPATFDVILAKLKG